MILNEYLAALRKQQKRTLTEVAKAVGCSPPHINDIERGNRRPSLKYCTKFAKIYEVPVEGLVERLFQDQLAHAGLALNVRVEAEAEPHLEEEEQDAVNEMVHSGWDRTAAIQEVIGNREPSGSNQEVG